MNLSNFKIFIHTFFKLFLFLCIFVQFMHFYKYLKQNSFSFSWQILPLYVVDFNLKVYTFLFQCFVRKILIISFVYLLFFLHQNCCYSPYEKYPSILSLWTVFKIFPSSYVSFTKYYKG